MNANKISVNVSIYALALIPSPHWKYYCPRDVDNNLLGFLCLVGVLCLCLRIAVKNISGIVSDIGEPVAIPCSGW